MVIAPKPFENVSYNQSKLNQLWRQQLDQTLTDRQNLAAAGLMDFAMFGTPSGLAVTNWGYSFDYNPTTYATAGIGTLTITFPYLIDCKNFYYDVINEVAGKTCTLSYSTDGINYTAINSVGGAMGRMTGTLSNLKILTWRMVISGGTCRFVDINMIGKKYDLNEDFNPLM